MYCNCGIKIQIQDFWCLLLTIFFRLFEEITDFSRTAFLYLFMSWGTDHKAFILVQHLKYPTWNLGTANGSWMSVYKYLKNGSVCKRSISQSDLKSQQSLDMHLTSLNLYCIESKIQVNSLYRIVKGFSLLEILDFLGL